MKKLLVFISAAVLAISSFCSCNKTDSNPIVQAIVTAKSDESGKLYLQLTEDTILYPTNLDQNLFGRELRALTSYYDLGEVNSGLASYTVRSAELIYLDSINTKKLVPTVGEKDDEVYGDDPIDILYSWATGIEDGYINLHYEALAQQSISLHSFNLVKGTDPENPYLLVLHHDYGTDTPSELSRTDGVVAFDIKELLTLEAGHTYTITMKFQGIGTGERTINFEYTPSEDAKKPAQ